MNPTPGTLRAYANIFELQRRDPRSGTLMPPGELSTAAAKALRFHADALEARSQEVARWEQTNDYTLPSTYVPTTVAAVNQAEAFVRDSIAAHNKEFSVCGS